MDIEKYLDLDAHNAQSTLALLRTLNSALAIKTGNERTLSQLLDSGLMLYEALLRAFSAGARDDDDQRTFNSCCERLDLTGDEMLEAIETRQDATADRRATLEEAMRARDGGMGRRVRGLLLTALGRSFVFGSTDLLRLRISDAHGALRWAAEAAALIELIHATPSIAVDWIGILPDGPSGPRFFGKHKKAIRDVMVRRGLLNAYDGGSGMAMHARLVGMVYGLTSNSFIEGDREVHELELSFQELAREPDRSRQVLLHTIYYLEVHRRIFLALPSVLPEIQEPLLLGAHLPRFARDVQAHWGNLERTYPEWAAEMRRNLDNRSQE